MECSFRARSVVSTATTRGGRLVLEQAKGCLLKVVVLCAWACCRGAGRVKGRLTAGIVAFKGFLGGKWAWSNKVHDIVTWNEISTKFSIIQPCIVLELHVIGLYSLFIFKSQEGLMITYDRELRFSEVVSPCSSSEIGSPKLCNRDLT